MKANMSINRLYSGQLEEQLIIDSLCDQIFDMLSASECLRFK